MTDVAQIKNILLPVMKIAGTAILDLQKNGLTIELKANKDIVTKADLLADQIIKTELNAAFPDIGWLSEESVDHLERLKLHRVWIVDPIDGTREFATGIPEYAISVALVENGLPIIAAVYNPAVEELFYSVKGNGTYLNDKRVYCKSAYSDKLSLLASRSEYKRGEWDRFMQNDVKVVGSIAYKLALIAAGFADATFSLGPKNEWDIAAGVLLVQEAGGIVTTKDNQPMHFNQKNVLVNGIIATSNAAHQKVIAMIASP